MKSSHLLACALLLCPVGCANAERLEPPSGSIDHTVNFTGFVYDGATGKRLSGYTINLQVQTDQLAGTVQSDGRFVDGPISAWDDYSVLISGTGYRNFVSHNKEVGLPSGDTSTEGSEQTLHYDAYLFPSNLQSPKATLTIQTDVPSAMPAGTIRFRPTAPSSIDDPSADQPAGVPGQVWANAEDLQAATLSGQFMAGTFALNAGDLVYGVRYRVDIFGVTGQQPFVGDYTPGAEGDKTFTLSEVQATPLAVVSSTANMCKPPVQPLDQHAASFTVTFNTNVEWADMMSAYNLDAGLQICNSDRCPDKDMDMQGKQNILNLDADPTMPRRGTVVTFSGPQMKVEWNSGVGLLTTDINDPISPVTYTNLQSVRVRRIGSPASAQSLAALLGTFGGGGAVNSISCGM